MVPTGITSNWTLSLPFGEGGHPPAAALVPTSAVLHPQKGQFPGFGSSIRLANPVGTSDTTTVTRSTRPSLRTTCTSWSWSTKPDPAGTTWGVQVGSAAR
jgi:hypothetical protein